MSEVRMQRWLNPSVFRKIKIIALVALTIFVWAILAMIYLDRFVPPLDSLELVLMPWKAPFPSKFDLDQRLSLMETQLAGASRIASYAFTVMLVSFSSFTVYLSVLYQQKQRRARENMFLTMKNEEIARRNEFIRYISATIGHEFKNNLGRIKRRIDLLPDLPPEARERINENMHKLFSDIDIFKKISDEREVGLAEFRYIDVKSVLTGLSRQYADLADITLHEQVVVPRIYAAPPLVKTVFENLFDNAVKYKKQDQARARISVSCARDNDGGRQYVTISIRDEGIGMDELQADNCFYKGKGKGENWGQGLYFAKYVVGLHAGKIRVGKDYTAPGKGTEIIMKLPFVQEASHV